MDQDDKKQKLVEILKKVDTVMLVSDATNGTMHGRPMAIADVEPNGDLWFVTSRASEKTRELKADARALVTAQGSSLYASVSGRIDVVDDRRKVNELWKEMWKVWFPKGKEDPDIVLLHLRPDTGEYWDNAGTEGIRYLFEAAKALLSGEKAQPNDPEQHAKVKM
jgi:general stress protein 26